MTTLTVMTLALWLITVFVIACYALHLAIKTQIEIKAGALSKPVFVQAPEDPSWAADERKLNNLINGIEDDQIERAGQAVFRGGPIL